MDVQKGDLFWDTFQGVVVGECEGKPNNYVIEFKGSGTYDYFHNRLFRTKRGAKSDLTRSLADLGD